MNVNPGELKKTIQIMKKKSGRDKDGYPETGDEVVRECKASFKRTTGTETVKANADFGQIKARFLIRYTSQPITRKMFVRYNNENYNIIYVNDYEDKHEYIEIWTDIVEVG